MHPYPWASRLPAKTENGVSPRQVEAPALKYNNLEIGWEHFFFRSKAIYHGEAPNKTPLAMVLPITQTVVEIETNPLRVKLLGLVSTHRPKR